MVIQDSVKSLMTPLVISVLPDTPVLTAIDIILTNNFNGIPVVDKKGIIVGILTKYDLIVNRLSIKDDMKVADLMNTDPLVLGENMLIEEAVKAFAEHHRVDPIPVVDENRKVVGVISRFDMIKLFREYGISKASLDKSDKEGTSPMRPRKSYSWILVLIGFVLALATLYYFY